MGITDKIYESSYLSPQTEYNWLCLFPLIIITIPDTEGNNEDCAVRDSDSM